MIHCEQLDEEVVERMQDIFQNYVNILYPITYGVHKYNSVDLNANSIVINISIDGFHFLFMGDATSKNEQLILDECTKNKIDLKKTI